MTSFKRFLIYILQTAYGIVIKLGMNKIYKKL